MANGTVNMALMRAMMGLEPEPTIEQTPMTGTQPAPGQQGMFGGMDSNDLSIMLGQLAQAIAPDYWAGRVGGVAAQMGARSKQQAQEKQQAQVLAGEAEQQQSEIARALGLTPDGQAGPTKMTIGADGRFTTTGQIEGARPVGGQAPQTPQVPQAAPRPKTDLTTLSPQQIQNVMTSRRGAAETVLTARKARIDAINADRANRQLEAQMAASERDRSERNDALKRLSGFTMENINEAPADALATIDKGTLTSLINAYSQKYVADIGAAKGDQKLPDADIQLMREIEKQSKEQGVAWNETPIFKLVMLQAGREMSREQLMKELSKSLIASSPAMGLMATEKPSEFNTTVTQLADAIMGATATAPGAATVGEEAPDIIQTIQDKYRKARGQ